MAEATTKDLEEKIDNIPIYKITMAELSKIIGRHITLVDTGEPNKYIDGYDNGELRIKANNLGADAIVDYQANSGGAGHNPYVSGTPVKILWRE